MPPERKECERDYDWHRHYYRGTLGLLITMHDEVDQVDETLSRVGPRLVQSLVVRSGSEPLPKTNPSRFELLPDLGGVLSKWELPAASVTRNYEALFKMAAGTDGVDWWVAITGDTVLLHEYGLERAVADADGKGCVLAACCAYGQEFHRADLTLEELEAGGGGGRKQRAGTSDFMPQLFMVKGEAVRAGLFSEIPITNKWTTEQCLGDAFVAWAGEDWRARRHLYAVKAASYSDGVVHHARHGA